MTLGKGWQGLAHPAVSWCMAALSRARGPRREGNEEEAEEERSEGEKQSAPLPGWMSGPAHPGPSASGPWWVFDALR